MKKILALMALFVMLSPVYAGDIAQLKFNIQNAISGNRYYLCLYGVGCLSIHAGSHGKIFPLAPIDMGNILKMVITDSSNMRMYTQDNVKSCSVKVKSGQQMTIHGHFVVTSNGPMIQGLHCSVSSTQFAAN